MGLFDFLWPKKDDARRNDAAGTDATPSTFYGEPEDDTDTVFEASDDGDAGGSDGGDGGGDGGGGC